jgi:hypothetical protein
MKQAIHEIERELLEETGKRLAQFGFSSRPTAQSFTRGLYPDSVEAMAGRAAVHLSFIQHEANVDVTMDVAIRFDAVEDLVQRSNELLSPKEKSQTFTLGAEIGNLERGEPFRMTVSNAADLKAVADSVVTKSKAVGLPYIERYSRPAAAYEVLSKDDRDAWLHSPIHSQRAKRACALLVAMGKQSELASLGARKLAFLQAVKDPGATAFARFLAELSSG